MLLQRKILRIRFLHTLMLHPNEDAAKRSYNSFHVCTM